MSENDRDLVALFAAEPTPSRDDAFVARVALDVTRAHARRVWMMSAAGLALGISGSAALALIFPILKQAGSALGQALQAPGASWIAMAAGLAVAVAVPLWRAHLG